METPDVNNSQVYKHEFQEGLNVFEQSFDGFQKSKFEAQKEQYNKAMHESLSEMRDAASGMMNKELQKLRGDLSTNLDNYVKNPSAANEEKVENSINQIKSAD
ncbi:MAG: hypothetical protein P0S95_03380 [Rhabdochlamydiaceae bacterium]|nr:hypothetical protein [Candidatus Amphrikana amoebophyrae]